VSGLTTIGNAMIAPLGDYAMRGGLWYQGETNAGGPGDYAALLGALMGDWRARFGADLPVLIVQLPNFGAPVTAPTASGWADLREAQRRAVAADAHAGLVVTIDVGENEDLHPPNKRAVGVRLARAARHVVYGEAITPSGPEVVRARRDGERVVVTFGEIDGALVSYSGAPNGFELCGETQASCRFVTAAINGSDVVLEGASEATRVRYCWGDGPVCTLYDRAGLPAGPFEIAIQ
jgi:sialate O-acetylesterase